MSGPDFAVLADQLVERVRHHLSADERHYASDYPPPVISAGRDSDGSAVLVVSYAGGTSQCEWDGSTADAETIIEDAAQARAYEISQDWWETEGWRGGARSEERRPGSP